MDYANTAPPLGLGTLLRALLGQLEPHVEEAYSDAVPGMRSRYYPVMRALLIRETSTVGEIAAAVGVSQPAMTQTIRQMVEDGLLDMEPGQDRRSRHVRLSAQGKAACNRLAPVWASVAEAAGGLEQDIGAELIAILERALAALETRDFGARIAEAMEAGR